MNESQTTNEINHHNHCCRCHSKKMDAYEYISDAGDGVKYVWDVVKYMFRVMQVVVVLAIFIIIVKHFF